MDTHREFADRLLELKVLEAEPSGHGRGKGQQREEPGVRGPWIRKTGANLQGRGAEQTLAKRECGPGGALRVTLLPGRSTCQTLEGHRAPRGPKQEQKDGAWGGKMHLPVRP